MRRAYCLYSCLALNAIHHEFDIVIGFGDLCKSNLCSCQVGAYGHATVITVAVNKRTNDRLRWVPCSISLRNGKNNFSFHDVAWERIFDEIFG